MHTFARMPVLELAHYQVHRLHTVEPVSEVLRLAERATPLHNLEALTIEARSGSHPRIFKTIDPILTRVHGDFARAALDSLTPYAETLQPERRHFLAQYTPLDVAFKIVGTGSVGLRDYCLYLQGNGPKDPLFLQVKEETLSAYAPYLGNAPAESHQGRRVVEGQRAMQFQSDPFLGYTTIQGRDFLVRQLNDHKAAVEMSELKSAGLLEYATVCGETLARGHARSGDPCVIAGYIGASARFDSAIARFAAAYATQTERDWKILLNSRSASQRQVRNRARCQVAPTPPQKSRQSARLHPNLPAPANRNHRSQKEPPRRAALRGAVAFQPSATAFRLRAWVEFQTVRTRCELSTAPPCGLRLCRQ